MFHLVHALSLFLICKKLIIESPVNSWTYRRPHWFDNVKLEHTACRQKVALFDLSSFAKLEIEVVKSINVSYYYITSRVRCFKNNYPMNTHISSYMHSGSRDRGGHAAAVC